MSDKKLSEHEIDEIVIAQADDDAAWDAPIDVQVDVATTLSLSPELAAKAAFFARLHNMENGEAWLQTIIKERIAFEESAFADLKQVMERKAPYRTE